jgi:hypothetical protein
LSYSCLSRLSQLRKGSEIISRVCFYFFFHGTEFRDVFSSTEGFGTEFRDFLFRGTAGFPSEITICSVYSVFRGIIFLSEIPNPSLNQSQKPALERGGVGMSIEQRLPPPPHHHHIFQLIRVDISSKDDVTVILLLGISFVILNL